MRWFKHYSNAHTNNLLEMLLAQKNGHEYYAMYWLLLELLCQEFKKDTTVFKISSNRLMAALGIRYERKLNNFLNILVELCAAFDEDLFTSRAGVSTSRAGAPKSMTKFYVIETPIILELMGKEFKRTRAGRGQDAAKKENKNKNKKKEKIKEKKDESNAPLIDYIATNYKFMDNESQEWLLQASLKSLKILRESFTDEALQSEIQKAMLWSEDSNKKHKRLGSFLVSWMGRANWENLAEEKARAARFVAMVGGVDGKG